MENTSMSGQSASSAAGASGTMSEQEMNEALVQASTNAGTSTGTGSGIGGSGVQGGADYLRDRLSELKSSLDALVRRAPGMSAEELSQAQARLMAQFESLQHVARDFASEAGRQFNRGVETTSVYVREKPMQSAAVGLGLLLGLLLKRR